MGVVSVGGRAWRAGVFVLVFVAGAASPGGRTPQQPVAEPVAAEAVRPSFEDWLGGVRDEAIAQGLRPGVVRAALADVQLQDVVVSRDQAQTEYVLTLDQYVRRRVTADVVRTACDRLARHRELLDRVHTHYGVEPAMLVSVWGLESNFGRFAGVRPTIPVLATLAYQARRGDFFRGQLFDALRILDRGDIELSKLKGSWAGALGQPQFMPGSYLRFAVDFDEDGRRDIWTSPADVFASIANYLRQNGWTRGDRWGREVRVSDAVSARIARTVPFRESGCRAARELTARLPLSEWQALGVRLPGGGALPRADMEASLLRGGARDFLVYPNYEVLLTYNCANSYAVAVGVLADRVAAAGDAPPAKRAPAKRRPSRQPRSR